jgi:hypothetical protein
MAFFKTLTAAGALFAVTTVVFPMRARAQDTAHATPPPVPAVAPVDLPFGVGEQLSYMVAVGGARVGTGQMEISGIENVRGRDAFHGVFTVDGGFLMFKVHDVLESWFDTATLSSRRFVQKIKEVNYKKDRYFEIYPEQATYQQRGDSMSASVAEPLDDASFLYFVRTVPLEIGKTYTFNRYFRPDRNPVIVKVLRRERVTVPAGTFNTIVIQPIIKSQGIFAEGGEAQMWLSDDDRHMMVQFKAKVPYLKTLDLYLQSYRPPTNTAASARQ